MTAPDFQLPPDACVRLLSGLGQPVIATDLELRVTCWNVAAVETFGWTLEQALGENVLDLAVPAFTRSLTEDVVAALIAGDRRQGALTVRRKDGTTFTALVSADGVRDQTGALIGLAAVVSNIGQMLHPLLMRSQEAAVVTDVEALVRYASPAVEQVLGWTDADLAGQPLLDRVHADDHRIVEACLQAHPVCGPTVDFRFQAADGGWSWVEAVVADLRDDPSVLGLVWTFRDTSGRRAELRQMTRAALHDPLTGLPNRTLMLNRLARATARRESRGVLLFLDLDRFKQVNDELGHAAGDALLRTVARRLEHVVRSEDSCGRWSGDEFLVLNESVRSRAEARALADRVTTALAQPVEIAGRLLAPRASIGLCMLDGFHEPEGVLRRADEEMYRVKRSRRATREARAAARARPPQPSGQDAAAADEQVPAPSAPGDGPPQGFPVIALVSSVGGAHALAAVLAPLQADFPAAVVALQHLDPRHASSLTERLAAVTALEVRTAADGNRLRAGVVDVCPPGRHVLLSRDDVLLLVDSADRPSARPSADLLLTSMAAVLGPRLLTVVLTGNGADGAVGAQVVTRYGGRTLVQDEDSSQSFEMPRAAEAADSPGPPVALEDLARVVTEHLQR